MNKAEDLILGVAVDSIDIIRHLVESEGVEINAFNNRGHTALCVACAYGNLEVARFLITHRADVNKPLENTKTTPLHIASSNGFTDLVTLLRDCGADLRARDSGGLSALDYAGISPQPVTSEATRAVERLEHGDEQLVLMRRQCLRALS
jgi:ankyrin repeat protein